jgi:hypothetical protein
MSAESADPDSAPHSASPSGGTTVTPNETSEATDAKPPIALPDPAPPAAPRHLVMNAEAGRISLREKQR